MSLHERGTNLRSSSIRRAPGGRLRAKDHPVDPTIDGGSKLTGVAQTEARPDHSIPAPEDSRVIRQKLERVIRRPLSAAGASPWSRST